MASSFQQTPDSTINFTVVIKNERHIHHRELCKKLPNAFVPDAIKV